MENNVRVSSYYFAPALGFAIITSIAVSLAYVFLMHEGIRSWLDFENESHFESFRWVVATAFGLFALVGSFVCAYFPTRPNSLANIANSRQKAWVIVIGIQIALMFAAYVGTVWLGHSFADVISFRVLGALGWRFAVVGVLQIIVAYFAIRLRGGSITHDSSGTVTEWK